MAGPLAASASADAGAATTLLPPLLREQEQEQEGGRHPLMHLDGAAPASLLPPSTKVQPRHHHPRADGDADDDAPLGPTAAVAAAQAAADARAGAESRLPAPPPPPPRPDTGARRGARPNAVARAAARLSLLRAQRLSARELDALLRAAFAPVRRSPSPSPPPPNGRGQQQQQQQQQQQPVSGRRLMTPGAGALGGRDALATRGRGRGRERDGGGSGNGRSAKAEEGGPQAPVMSTLPSAELDGVASADAPDVARRFAELARAGEFHAAVQLLQAAAGAGRADAVARLSHRAFLRAAKSARAPREALAFLRALPDGAARDPRTYTLALSVCAAAASPGAAQAVQDVMAARGVPLDLAHSTALMGVASRSGSVQQAFRHYTEAKQAAQQEALRAREAKRASNQHHQGEEARRAAEAAASAADALAAGDEEGGGDEAGGQSAAAVAAARAPPPPPTKPARLPPARLDSTAYGALIHSCAVAVREAEAHADRKTQLVLLERALGVVDEALSAGASLDAPAWNALLLCAGRAGQLQRAFEVLDRMTGAGVAPTSATYCGLMEACVLARRPALALRVFRRALAAPAPPGAGGGGRGSGSGGGADAAPARSVQIYTAAVNACIRLGRAQDRAIAAALQQRERPPVGGSVGLGALPAGGSSALGRGAGGGLSAAFSSSSAERSDAPSDAMAAFAGNGSGFGGGPDSLARRGGGRQQQQHHPSQGDEPGWGRGLDALLAAAGSLADGGPGLGAGGGAVFDDDDEDDEDDDEDGAPRASSSPAPPAAAVPAGGSAAAFDAALDVYAAAQRSGVEPDDLLCGNLVALAGRAGRLDAVAALVDDQRAAHGRPLGPAAASALVHALLASGDGAGAVRAYEAARGAGVPLHAAQYNALMELHTRGGPGAGGAEEAEHEARADAAAAAAATAPASAGAGASPPSSPSSLAPAPRLRLGDVIAVVEDMVRARVAPTPNTYRVLLAACQRAGCAELAFEVHQCAKRRGVVLRDRAAQSAAYSLLKACHNRIRAGWERGSGWRPSPAAAAAAAAPGGAAAAEAAALRGAGQPGAGSGISAAALASASLRPAQARALLAALELAGAASGGAAWPPQASSASSASSPSAYSSSSSSPSSSPRDAGGVRRHAFLDYSDNINWPQLAVATYRDFVSQGLRPMPHVLDAVLACLRQRYRPPAVPAALLRLAAQEMGGGGADAGDDAASNGCAQTAEILRDLRREAHATSASAAGGDRPYEYALDRRAMDVVGEAVAAGWLPAFRTDAPFTADLRRAPPTLSEAYVLWVLNSLVLSAAAAAASSASSASSSAASASSAGGGMAGGLGGGGGPSADTAVAVAAAMMAAGAAAALDGGAGGGGGSAVGEGGDASSSASFAARNRVARYPVRFIVPRYDANYVNWPSWLPKETLHYDEDGCSGGAVARRRAAAAFSVATSSRGAGLGGGGGSHSMEESMGEEEDDAAARARERQRRRRAARRGGGAGGAGGGAGAARAGGRRAADPASPSSSSGMGAAGYYHVIGAATAAGGDGSAAGAGDADAAGGAGGEGGGGGGASSSSSSSAYAAREATALATAATMRRLKVFALADPSSGVLTLPADELNRWVFARAAYEAAQRAKATADGYGDVYTGPWDSSGGGGGGLGGLLGGAAAAAARRRGGAAGAAGAGPAGLTSPAALLAQQQRNIRLGISLGAPPLSAFQRQMQLQQQQQREREERAGGRGSGGGGGGSGGGGGGPGSSRPPSGPPPAALR